MNFSIYLNDEVVQKLDAIALEENISRNKLIAGAIARLIKERESEEWSEEILTWRGDPEFELPSRDDLTEPREEIF